jgi:hypothetical protein
MQNVNQITPDGSLTFEFGSPNMADIPDIVETQTPGTPGNVEMRSDAYYDRTGDPRPTAGAGTAGTSSFSVGDQSFGTREEAAAHRQQLVNEAGGDGMYTWTDPYTGQSYSIPKITATQTLSESGQAIKDQNDKAALNLAELAANQSGRLDDLLSNPMDMASLPDRKQYADTALPDLQGYGDAPDLASILDGASELTKTFDRGDIQKTVGGSQDFTRGVDVPGLKSTVQATGAQTGQIGDAGAINPNANIGRIGNLPQVNTNYKPQDYATGFEAPGGIQSSAGGQGIRDVGGFDPIKFNAPDAGSFKPMGQAGEILREFDNVDPVDRNIAASGNILDSFGQTKGDIQYGYGGDFAEQADEVQNAIMDRLAPGQERDLKRLEARLASQGLRVGSEGYKAAMDDYSRSVNDSRLGAVLARGQEQSRLVGMERDRAVFNNNAQQQDYLQQFQRGQFANNAQAQRFAQNAQRKQTELQAQAQEFQMLAERARFSNAAQAQQYQQMADQYTREAAEQNNVFAREMAAAGMDLQAQTTNANLGLQRDQMGINRDQAAAGLELERGRFANDAQAQGYGQAADQARFAQDATARGNADKLAAAGLSSDNQRFNVSAGMDADRANIDADKFEATYGLDAQGRQFDQNVTRANYEDQQSTQTLLNELQASGFSNDALMRIFGMDMQNAEMSNGVLSEIFGQNLASANFANDAQGRDFDQNMDLAGLNNSAQAQEVQRMLARAGLMQGDIENDRISTDQLNSLLSGQYDRTVSADKRAVDQANTQRDQALNEMLTERNQPLNEIIGLLSGSQVQNPNFINPNVSGIANTDTAGIISNSDQQKFQAYQAQMAQRQSLIGGILGLGAGYLGGL